MACHYFQAGAVRLVLAGVVETGAERAGYEEALGVPLSICRLRVALPVVHGRLAQRHADDEDVLRWHLDRSHELDGILEEAAVEDFVVEATQDNAAQVAVVDPAKDVMCLAPRKRTVTTWPGAAAVPYFQGGAGGAGEQPPGPAQVDHGPFLVEEAGEDLGVAAKVGAQARGDRVSVIESSGAGPVLQ